MRARRRYVDAAWGQVHCTYAGEEGPWVCLFHESPLSGEVWVEVIERLAASARVVAFDTPGYGASDPPESRDHELVEYADVLAEAVTAFGVEDPVLCGSHTGASLAIEIAHRVPGVRGLVLRGCRSSTSRSGPSTSRAGRRRCRSSRGQPVPLGGRALPAQLAELDARLLHTAGRAVPSCRRALRLGVPVGLPARSGPPLAALDLPVLLLAAEHDMLAAKDEVAMKLARNVRLQMMPGLPGQAYLRQPEQYAEHLGAFAHECSTGAESA